MLVLWMFRGFGLTRNNTQWFCSLSLQYVYGTFFCESLSRFESSAPQAWKRSIEPSSNHREPMKQQQLICESKLFRITLSMFYFLPKIILIVLLKRFYKSEKRLAIFWEILVQGMLKSRCSRFMERFWSMWGNILH